MSTESAETTDESLPGFGRPLPEFVDWIAAALVALVGLALTVGGSVLTFVVDREMLDDGVESGQITVDLLERDLTQAETVEFTLEVVNWTGLGLLVTGAGLVVFAIGYVVARHRAYRRAADEAAAGSYRAYVVLGAVATSVLSFVPLSPVVGGALAGYYEHYESGRSVSAGALSGFLAAVPGLALLVFVTGGLFAGLSAVQASGLGIVTAAVLLLAFLIVGAYGAGLGALGGFAGGRLAESD